MFKVYISTSCYTDQDRMYKLYDEISKAICKQKKVAFVTKYSQSYSKMYVMGNYIRSLLASHKDLKGFKSGSMKYLTTFDSWSSLFLADVNSFDLIVIEDLYLFDKKEVSAFLSIEKIDMIISTLVTNELNTLQIPKLSLRLPKHFEVEYLTN